MYPILRPYLPQDLSAVLTIWETASASAHPFLSAKYLSRERRAIPKTYLPQAETWVALDDGQVLGFIALMGDEVGALFVDPQFHGSGIGQALLAKAQVLRSALMVQVFEKNQKALAFYKLFGFVELRQVPHEESGQQIVQLQLQTQGRYFSTRRAEKASGGDI